MSRWKRLADGVRAVARGCVAAGAASVRAARLAIGIPDYGTYVAHVRRRHPELEPMSREAFFRERMHARYGRGRNRCC